MAELFFIYNNKFYSSGTTVISSENRSLRYGDGLFETMKLVNEKIINSQFHFDRLFKGLNVLHFEIPKNHSSIIKVIGVGGGGSNAVNYMHSLGNRSAERRVGPACSSRWSPYH